MKIRTVCLLLCAGLSLLLWGCGTDPSTQQNEPEIGGAPMDITSFSFHCTTSYADGCYSLSLERTEEGVHLRGEDLFVGGRTADAMIEEDALDRLGELAGYYRIDRWNGFDKNKKHVSDGSSFTLNLTLADGGTVTAHGSNAFPDNYSDFYSEVLTLYTQLMERYGTKGADTYE